jgi:tryptophan-rich sensory protein
METQKKTPFFTIIISLVIAMALYKLFNPISCTFNKPYLALVYTAVLVFNIYSLIRIFRYNRNIKKR